MDLGGELLAEEGPRNIRTLFVVGCSVQLLLLLLGVLTLGREIYWYNQLLVLLVAHGLSKIVSRSFALSARVLDELVALCCVIGLLLSLLG